MSILSDIRLAVRFLARRPAEPALIAGLFALSIGLASGMWAVVDAVALRPLPYRDGGALVAVLESHPARGLMAVAPANFLDWASRVKTVQDATGLGRLEASITGNGEPIRTRPFRMFGVLVTGLPSSTSGRHVWRANVGVTVRR